MLLFADSVRYAPAQTQKLLAGKMGRTPYHKAAVGQYLAMMLPDTMIGAP